MLFFMICVCNSFNAQSFKMTDNLLLSEISKNKFYKCFKKSKHGRLNVINGKKQSPYMDFLINTPVIKNQIIEQWGNDYCNYDEFEWGYYKLNSNTKYKYIVIVDQPINPITYLLSEDLQVDSITIHGLGMLTKDNIYFTTELYDSDETVHLNWYSINGNQVKHIAELKENSFEYIMLEDIVPDSFKDGKDANLFEGVEDKMVLWGCFGDGKGNYYCAIENKITHKKKYYKLKLKINSNIIQTN